MQAKNKKISQRPVVSVYTSPIVSKLLSSYFWYYPHADVPVFYLIQVGSLYKIIVESFGLIYESNILFKSIAEAEIDCLDFCLLWFKPKEKTQEITEDDCIDLCSIWFKPKKEGNNIIENKKDTNQCINVLPIQPNVNNITMYEMDESSDKENVSKSEFSGQRINISKSSKNIAVLELKNHDLQMTSTRHKDHKNLGESNGIRNIESKTINTKKSCNSTVPKAIETKINPNDFSMSKNTEPFKDNKKINTLHSMHNGLNYNKLIDESSCDLNNSKNTQNHIKNLLKQEGTSSEDLNNNTKADFMVDKRIDEKSIQEKNNILKNLKNFLFKFSEREPDNLNNCIQQIFNKMGIEKDDFKYFFDTKNNKTSCILLANDKTYLSSCKIKNNAIINATIDFLGDFEHENEIKIKKEEENLFGSIKNVIYKNNNGLYPIYKENGKNKEMMNIKDTNNVCKDEETTVKTSINDSLKDGSSKIVHLNAKDFQINDNFENNLNMEHSNATGFPTSNVYSNLRESSLNKATLTHFSDQKELKNNSNLKREQNDIGDNFYNEKYENKQNHSEKSNKSHHNSESIAIQKKPHERVNFSDGIHKFCQDKKCPLPEYIIEKQNDVFLCTASFMDETFSSNYFYEKEQAKQDVCKKIFNFIDTINFEEKRSVQMRFKKKKTNDFKKDTQESDLNDFFESLSRNENEFCENKMRIFQNKKKKLNSGQIITNKNMYGNSFNEQNQINNKNSPEEASSTNESIMSKKTGTRNKHNGNFFDDVEDIMSNTYMNTHINNTLIANRGAEDTQNDLHYNFNHEVASDFKGRQNLNGYIDSDYDNLINENLDFYPFSSFDEKKEDLELDIVNAYNNKNRDIRRSDAYLHDQRIKDKLNKNSTFLDNNRYEKRNKTTKDHKRLNFKDIFK